MGAHRSCVVITGATAGVGRATAQRFARAGWAIAILARGRVALQATQDELLALGAPEVLALSVDVSDATRVNAAAREIEDELGPIEVWINNAMTTVYGRVDDVSPAEYARVTDVVYHGYVWGTQAALSAMRPRNRGTIVQVGSSLAYRGIPLQAAYCGAKHAIRAFTDALRCELLHDGVDIQLTMVQLPSVNTPQFDHAANKMERRPQPVPPIYQPEVAADAIFHAAFARERELFVGLPTLELIYAQKTMPGVLDHYLAHQVWQGQLTDEPVQPNAASNLFTPVERDVGAHGRFDARARAHEVTALAREHRGALTLALLALPLLGAAMWWQRTRRAEWRA
jgi:short-subunit dehydrogenase